MIVYIELSFVLEMALEQKNLLPLILFSLWLRAIK